MLPTGTDLQTMGYTYFGEPFVELDATLYLTSPGYMGVTHNGQPVTFAPQAFAPIVEFRRVNTKINVGSMGIKRPHMP